MVDENLEFDEADEALPAVEHHSGTADAKINTLESEGKCSPSTESRSSVPVNLTC